MVSRGDLKPQHQAIQATHAALALAYATGPPEEGHPSLVHLVQGPDQSLEELLTTLQEQGVAVEKFEESYRDWGLTAIACYLTENQRHLLANLTLWRSH
jgi:hypothetical protein